MFFKNIKFFSFKLIFFYVFLSFLYSNIKNILIYFQIKKYFKNKLPSHFQTNFLNQLIPYPIFIESNPKIILTSGIKK